MTAYVKIPLQLIKDFHDDVVSLVECIEECEEDGGKSYSTLKTRELLGNVYPWIVVTESTTGSPEG